MGIGDKIQHAAEELTGRVKQAAGSLTDNRELKAKGEAQEAKANLGQAGDRVADAGDEMGQATAEVKDDLANAADSVKEDAGQAVEDVKDAFRG
jgi:uncharacterized protein YjbJ (UPF0337 family)